ncbi:hypothetical protein KC333_g3151 [Hortaea werneckii]|nr:hypothetical protein KC333_g3151 [Hortaea werneckii]
MAQKRKAQDAFGKSNGQLSAFAVARLAKQSKATPAPASPPPLATVIIGDEAYSNHADEHADGGAESDYDHAIENVQGNARSPKASSCMVLSAFDRTANSPDRKDGSVTVTIHNSQYVTCVGEYNLQVLQGLATLYGAVVHPGSGLQKVYAPSTHALPSITARRDNTVIRLSNVNSSMRKLDNLSPNFRNIWAAAPNTSQTFALLETAADDESQRILTPLEVDKTLQNVLTRLTVDAEGRGSRIMAIGAKSSGKSTFNRLLCNSILSKPSVKKLLYLDLDPGQPEFTPPGQVALVEVSSNIFGPSFTHAASSSSQSYRLLRTHTLAATTFKDDPAHYMACAQDLISHAGSRLPLVINSCGWVSGLGANVLADVVSAIGLSEAVIFDPVEEPFVEWLQNQPSKMAVHRLPRQASRPSPRTPAEIRAMHNMAYFHQRESRNSGDRSWSGKPISSLRPWTISYGGPTADIIALLSYGQAPSPAFLAEVLDGSLVAVVTVDAQHMDEAFGMDSYADFPGDAPSLDGIISRTAEELPYIRTDCQGITHPLHPRYSECVGLALVRAMDTKSKQLHLITPLPDEKMAALSDKKVVLVRGSFDAPEWAYLEDLYFGSNDSFDNHERPWVSKKEPAGIEGAVWRLRHPPMANAVNAR